MVYLQTNHFQILRPAPNAEIIFPRLAPDEIVVLDADMGHHHVYIQCLNQADAKEAIEQTLFTALSHTFFVASRRN